MRTAAYLTVCPLPMVMDTYNGCSHNCKYCYAEAGKVKNITPVDGAISSMKNYITGKRSPTEKWCDWNLPVKIGSLSDPLQPCEKKFKQTEKALRLLAQYQYPYLLISKGRLLVDDIYLSLFKQSNSLVHVSIVTPQYDKYEPGAPPFEERLEIIKKLCGYPKRVNLRIQPYEPEYIDDACHIIETAGKCGVYGIIVGFGNYGQDYEGAERYLNNVYSTPAKIQSRHLKILKEKCHENGLKFFSAECQFRWMSDDPTCCCGTGGLGWRVNTYNTYEILNGNPEAMPSQKLEGSATCFITCYRQTGVFQRLKSRTFVEEMDREAAENRDYYMKMFNLKGNTIKKD